MIILTGYPQVHTQSLGITLIMKIEKLDIEKEFESGSVHSLIALSDKINELIDAHNEKEIKPKIDMSSDEFCSARGCHTS